MKILLACQQSPQTYAIPAYGFWRTYFVEGLREAGHEVVEVPGVDWARGLTTLPGADRARWLDENWSRTLDVAHRTPALDLFLGYLYPNQIDTSAVRALQALGLPVVNFFCDNLREYRRLPSAFAPFDLHWVPEHDALPLYAARGWRTLFAPMPCWIPPPRRSIAAGEERCVRFVGRRDSLRADLLAEVARAGLPLAVHGGGWSGGGAPAPVLAPSWGARLAGWTDYTRRQGLAPLLRRLRGRFRAAHATPVEFDFSPWTQPPPGDDAYADALACAAVCLGINRYPDAAADRPSSYSRLRDIEAPMLGACYLTEWAPEVPQLYEIGREVEVYRDAAELIALARTLLGDAPRRRALRLAGQRRALVDHTVGATIARIARSLGLPLHP